MKWVHTLVDYDNAIQIEERTQSDVTANVAALASSLTTSLSTLIPDSQELWCRLYGGWMTLDSQLTHRAGWLLAELQNFRRRIGPLRVRMTIARELLARDDLTLIGTYQKTGDKMGQKMVDGMLSVDVLELAAETTTSLVVVSDDDDFVPAIVAGGGFRTPGNPIHLLRRRKAVGSGSNDRILKRCNAVVAMY